MTIALSHPTTAPARPSALPADDTVTVTLTVSLPAGTSPTEAALIADSLHTQARRISRVRRGTSAVRIDAPAHQGQRQQGGPRQLGGQRQRALRSVPGSGSAPLAPRPLGSRTAGRPGNVGVVSPNSPALRDARAAAQARFAPRITSVASPDSPSAAPFTNGLVIDLYGRRVRLDGADVDFTHKEFELLAHLARNARTALTRGEIMETVWAGADASVGERTVDVHVRRVRAKLGRYRRLISTVRGAGYRLDPGSDVTILA